MEPFSPEDPLHKLLGKARPVEPRPNFTQNVLRAVRQLPQRQGVWERLRDLAMSRGVIAGAMTVLVIALFMLMNLWQPDASQTAPVAVSKTTGTTAVKPSALTMAVKEEMSDEPDIATELDNMNQLTVLLAQQDTAALTDSDLALLLY